MGLVACVDILIAKNTLNGRLLQAGDANGEKRPQRFGFVVLVQTRKVDDRINILLASEGIGILEMPLVALLFCFTRKPFLHIILTLLDDVFTPIWRSRDGRQNFDDIYGL